MLKSFYYIIHKRENCLLLFDKFGSLSNLITPFKQSLAEKPTTFGTPKNKPKISHIKTFIAKTQRHKIAI